MTRSKVEILIHFMIWAFILSTINVDWTVSWFDPSLRPRSPAPLSVIVFAVYFYTHTFLLLPRYFSLAKWKIYMALATLLFVAPELVRILFYQFALTDMGFTSLLFSRDSFLFGAPSPFFIAINASFIYRFTRDRLLKSTSLQEEEGTQVAKTTAAYEDANLLSDEAAYALSQQLTAKLENEELFLNPGLTLRDMAVAVGSTEKKVSYLINQHMHTSFYELVNSYRVEKFKADVLKPENKSLSIVGVALNCGFPSKSSFYRAFKSQVSLSPSAYIKKMAPNQ